MAAGTIAVGDQRVETLVTNLTPAQILAFAHASGDLDPLHINETFATEVAGYPTVVAHGMFTMGLAARILTTWVGPGKLRSYGSRFQKEVLANDTLLGTVTVVGLRDDGSERLADFSLEIRNQHGDVVLTGTASALVS